MTNEILAGLALGGFLVAPPLIIGVWLFSNSYEEGLKGKKLASIGPFGILGQTCDGVPVLVARFKEGQQLCARLQDLESRVREVEKTLLQTDNELRLLKKEIEELKKATLPQSVRDKLEELILIVNEITERQLNRSGS